MYGAMRWLHLYTSMVSLLLVLFFALTGITLNHPEWTFGLRESTQRVQGQLPSSLQNANPNFAQLEAFFRNLHGIKGQLADSYRGSGETQLSFRSPGYSADILVNSTGQYTLTEVSQGVVAMLNDLHRGRDAGNGWRFAIDLISLFLALVALTGLALGLFLRQVRSLTVWLALGGSVVAIAIMAVVTR